MSFVIDPAISALVTCAAAVLFGVAAAHKLLAIASFETVLAAYRVMPQALVPTAARLVPAVELACAVAMLIPDLRQAGVCVALASLAGYSAAIAVNLRRGRLHIDCGCSGFSRRQPIDSRMIARNACMAVVLACALAPQGARQLGVTDALTALGGGIALALLYFAAEELLATQSREGTES